MTKTKTSIISPAEAWDNVGRQWETLGKHLGTRLEKVRTTAVEDRVAIETSVSEMLTALEDALEQAGAIVRDRRLRKDLAELTQRVHDAIQLTVGAAEKQVRRRLPSAARRGPAKPASAAGPQDAKSRRPATKKGSGSKSAVTATKPAARAKAAAH
ncbi:MAG TPA: hypothetical protein VGN18_12735 [Jatrophihabitans sp.]|jgi:uncharacterized protein YllA (UPF0747 family)|uniref:hypothetical protein n=1 Tax=Jatrophihabitans sp. TaxID=1932789 RepID=UPI002E0A10C1|nr:hypothetical protein [Jatrophihabitans sp.]